MIMKLPSLTEKKKSKWSEESEIVTSSPYKQSLVENMIEHIKWKHPRWRMLFFKLKKSELF
jgi:hypothetical protein